MTEAVRRSLLFTCGNAELGRLGLRTLLPKQRLTLCISLSDLEISDVACGTSHTAVVSSCGSLFTWGSNESQQLGHSSDLSFVPVPRQVDIPEHVVGITCGYGHTLAVTKDGNVWAWGGDRHGQIGDGRSATVVNVPVKLKNLPCINRVSAGASHSLALSKDGEVFGWGSSAAGAVGLPREGMFTLKSVVLLLT